MAAPTLVSTYPSPDATGVPIAADIEIVFSCGVDLHFAKQNVKVYGPDTDMTSGPDSATWIDSDTGDNPLFLRSPGYTGLVNCEYSFIWCDSSSVEEDPQPDVLTRTQELAASYRGKLVITPEDNWAPNTEYTVYIIGDAEVGTDRGLSSTTVYDVDDSGATSTTAGIVIYGGFEGDVGDTVNLKITTAGDIGTAKYKWWYSSELEVDARTGKITSRRYRNLEDGLQVRFTGSGFILDDVYTISVETKELIATSYTFSFTTGTGSITDVPSSASTSVIGVTGTTGATEYLEVESMTPADGATHQRFIDKTITVVFSETLDATTVTDDTVTVYAYPISGYFTGPSSTSCSEPEELHKKLTVSGATLTIEV